MKSLVGAQYRLAEPQRLVPTLRPPRDRHRDPLSIGTAGTAWVEQTGPTATGLRGSEASAGWVIEVRIQLPPLSGRDM
ncbi:hypothetical protein NDU88_007237 [Pleurodeles waltl]|uniref:Uncharacterized protein n=1 Tax=Pleurodeles waltl TaxID=8319 RepID=A0AAV7VRL0_PLEWA|nr:hypothetical protein NDU88_007237 [Pleurodeles waltl]